MIASNTMLASEILARFSFPSVEGLFCKGTTIKSFVFYTKTHLIIFTGLSYKNGQVVVRPTFMVATRQNHDYYCLPA